MIYEPTTLLADYNTLMQAHGLPGKLHLATVARKKRGKVIRKATLTAIADFGAWCSRQGVDPIRYIRARHEAIGWVRMISFERLASDLFLVKFREWGDGVQANHMDQARLVAATEDDTPRGGLDLIHLFETFKRLHRTDRVLCRVEQDVTGGWNPRSPECAGCGEAGACTDMLPPDVRARRVE